MSSVNCPGGSAGKRHCPFSFDDTVALPPISACERTRTNAPGTTPPCASLTVPVRAPVICCAALGLGRTQAAARNSQSHGRGLASDGVRSLMSKGHSLQSGRSRNVWAFDGNPSRGATAGFYVLEAGVLLPIQRETAEKA